MNFADKMISLLENASTGIFFLDNDHRFVSVTQRFCQFLGYNKEELAGKSIKDVVYPQKGRDSSHLFDQAEKLMKLQGKNSFIRKDGQIVCGDLTIHLLQEVGEQFIYQFGVLTDITEKKAEGNQLLTHKQPLAEQEQTYRQREKSLKHKLNIFPKAEVLEDVGIHAAPSAKENQNVSIDTPTRNTTHSLYPVKNRVEEQWMSTQEEQNIKFQAQLLELIDSAIISLTQDLHIRTWSMGAETLFGISAEEAIGLRLTEVLLIRDYEHFLEGIIKENNGLNTTWKGEAVVIVRGQKTYPVYCTFAPLEGARGNQGYLLVCKDIEEISAIQHTLIAQQAYIVSVTENLSDSIFALNEKFEILYLNTAFKTTSKQYLGLDVKVGDNMYSLASEKGKKQLEQNWQKVLKGERVSYEYEFISAEGSHYFYDVYSNPIYGVKNEVTGVSYLYRDVTEKKKTEADLQQMQSEILSAQLHEQRVQAAALMEGQELERKRLGRELHDGLGQMLNVLKMQLVRNASSSEARQTVDHIMVEIIRLNNALMPLVLQDFGLHAGIRQLVEQYEKLTEAQFYYFSDINQQRFDPKFEISVYRIVQEAVSNAVKYAKAENISIQLILHAHTLLIMIEDDGVGFDSKAQKVKPGRGYGLLNMQFRVEAIVGKIAIDTDTGQGCVITIELPLKY